MYGIDIDEVKQQFANSLNWLDKSEQVEFLDVIGLWHLNLIAPEIYPFELDHYRDKIRILLNWYIMIDLYENT
jgi:hypothetical protein